MILNDEGAINLACAIITLAVKDYENVLIGLKNNPKYELLLCDKQSLEKFLEATGVIVYAV